MMKRHKIIFIIKNLLTKLLIISADKAKHKTFHQKSVQKNENIPQIIMNIGRNPFNNFTNKILLFLLEYHIKLSINW